MGEGAQFVDLCAVRKRREIIDAHAAAVEAIQNLRRSIEETRGLYLWWKAYSDQLEGR